MTLTFRECSPGESEVKPLLLALSAELLRITGNDGTTSFSAVDVQVERSIFLAALSGGEVVGCGGLRPISAEICEIKRMYAKYAGQGIDAATLQAIENRAIEFGYQEIRLETRRINTTAVRFYLRQGYREIPNYGKYVGRTEAICFGKSIHHYGG
jgi:ribosomal protein S18 acetylase RimI-like enzyme